MHTTAGSFPFAPLGRAMSMTSDSPPALSYSTSYLASTLAGATSACCCTRPAIAARPIPTTHTPAHASTTPPTSAPAIHHPTWRLGGLIWLASVVASAGKLLRQPGMNRAGLGHQLFVAQ